MIKRTRRNPSLIANPGGRRHRRRKANPSRRSRRNPLHRGRHVARKNPARRRRNPGSASGEFMGLPLVHVALGAAAAIALIQGVQGVKYVSDMVAKPGIAGKAIAPALAFAGGWAAYKYVKNPMVKSVGKYVMLTAVILGLNATVGTMITDKVKELTTPKTGGMAGLSGPSLSGAYLLANKSGGQVGGAYLQAPKQFGARNFT